MVIRACTIALIAAALGSEAQADDLKPSGDSVIRAKAGKSEIVIRTTSRLAGAIHSLTWDGKEFIDSADHGRQLQSASNFDVGKSFIPEVFNPTEAGSRKDGAGPTSTSRLLKIEANRNQLRTLNRMAFWLEPDEKSEGYLALNTTSLSNHLLEKQVKIGHKGMPHAIEYTTTFTVPKGENHKFAQFEAITGYMPSEFSTFQTFDSKTGKLKPLDDGPGEQSKPIVFSTPDGSHAMGIWSPDQPSPGFGGVGYGRFRFKSEKVVKWNCVFRVQESAGIKPRSYQFRQYVIVGTLDDVQGTLVKLVDEYKPKTAPAAP